MRAILFLASSTFCWVSGLLARLPLSFPTRRSSDLSARGRHVRPDREDPPHARGAGALEHGVEIARELREVQVRVGVEEIRSDHTAPRTAAVFFTSRAFTQRIAA